MDKDTRNSIQRATQSARALLERAFSEQLEGTFDILLDGTISQQAGGHLSARQKVVREKLVATMAHKRSTGLNAQAAVQAYLREAAFTTFNRFVALKMLEARNLVQECVSKGEASSGFIEFTALSPGIIAVEDKGYRLYIETLFDEIGQEVKVLFDRHDVASLLWPDRQTLLELLGILNAPDLGSMWAEDETIGWVYQYFNGDEERSQMRKESQAPRNSRELAVRNQFFTPRYVVQFLADNTLGRTWFDMMKGETEFEHLDYLVRRPNEVFLAEGELAPEPEVDNSKLSQEELLQQTVYVPFRAKKDPRDLRILDPACGSGHFLLYAFDLLVTIYEEAWSVSGLSAFTETGTQLCEDFLSIDELRCAIPELILRHSLYGVDIDPRAAQIAALALWMRAHNAFNQIDIDRAKRPPISRTNIVVAEPMPDDAELVEEFAAGLKPAILGDLFKKMVDEMKLGGELGSLLRIEEAIANAVKDAEEVYRQGDLFAEKTEIHEFWDSADEKIIAALENFAESAAGSVGIRRQLFASDATQGVALIELMRRRFDVVLMNPPFGLVQDGVFGRIQAEYPDTYVDVYSSFVSRGAQLAPHGLVGAITSRSFISSKKLVRWRQNQVLPWVKILIDLGKGVMDDANIESCAYVIAPNTTSENFIAVNSVQEKLSYELGLWEAIKRGVAEAYITPRIVIQNLPSSKLLYFISGRMASLLSSTSRFEPEIGTVRKGLTTFDDFRFLRLRWEVPSRSVGRGKIWELFAKGGKYNNYYADVHLLVKRGSGARELAARNILVNGQTAQSRQGEGFYYREGVQYTGRSQAGFSARFIPGDCAMSSNAPLVLSESNISTQYILGWLNSRLIRSVIEMQAMDNDFVPGIVKTLPWIKPTNEMLMEITDNVSELIEIHHRVAVLEETDPFFVLPWIYRGPIVSLQESMEKIQVYVEERKRRTRLLQNNVSESVDRLYGLNSDALGKDILGRDVVADVTIDDITKSELAKRTLSHFFGLAFEIREERDHVDEQEYSWAFASGLVPRYGNDEGPVLLFDDAGHADDVVFAVTSAGNLHAANIESLTSEIANELGTSSIRAYLSKKFFSEHTKQYSKSRRNAPIFWQLATPSASYSVWCYYHRLTHDTFFHVANDYVAPKIDHEESKLNALLQEAGSNSSSTMRKAIDVQENFVNELRAFGTEVTRIAPLWKPNLNDGVIINFAPLWRLVPQHKPWQKECKKVWDKLVKGDYDWAHLAMHLWPERVVPKCKADRSLAIAHGLEENFWYEDDDGNWQNRHVSHNRVEELIADRASAAVQAALKDLLDAPTPTGQTRRKQKART